jgi:hypothetical protein
MVQINIEKIVRETDKAIAIYHAKRFIWLPKSQVVIRKLAACIEIDIPERIWEHNIGQYSTKIGGLK